MKQPTGAPAGKKVGGAGKLFANKGKTAKPAVAPPIGIPPGPPSPPQMPGAPGAGMDPAKAQMLARMMSGQFGGG